MNKWPLKFTVQNHLVPSKPWYWVISPWLMEITIHRKTLFCFLDLQICHYHKTTAMLCCLGRAYGLSVIKLFCSAKRDTNMHFERANAHSTYQASSCLTPHGSSTLWWTWGFIWCLQRILSQTCMYSMHRFLSTEFFPSASSQSCSNLTQVLKRN